MPEQERGEEKSYRPSRSTWKRAEFGLDQDAVLPGSGRLGQAGCLLMVAAELLTH